MLVAAFGFFRNLFCLEKDEVKKLYEDKIALLEQLLKMKDEQIEVMKAGK